MPQLTPAQCQNLADLWQAYHDRLDDYDTARALDPGYDPNQVQAWMENAASMVTLYGTVGMATAFDDAVAAFGAMQNVTAQAGAMVQMLTAQANNWNRFATVGAAMLTFAGAISAGAAGPIFGAAVSVAQAYTSDPNADASAQAPPN